MADDYNLSQVKKNGIPVCSEDEQVRRNSMRLYTYLLCLSHFTGRNKPRRFEQGDFVVAQIAKELSMKPETVKKYWHILEDNRLVKYNGPYDMSNYFTKKQKQKLKEKKEGVPSWEDNFMARKRYKLGFYELPKEFSKYRIIPRETLVKMRTQFNLSENEIKLYLFLANLQEATHHMKHEEVAFTLKELRQFLDLKDNEAATNKRLYLNITWLDKLKLIKVRTATEFNKNLGVDITYFVLEKLYYYTDGGEAKRILDNNDGGKIPEDVKEQLLKESLVKFDEIEEDK